MVTMSWMVVKVASDVFLIWRHKWRRRVKGLVHSLLKSCMSSLHYHNVIMTAYSAACIITLCKNRSLYPMTLWKTLVFSDKMHVPKKNPPAHEHDSQPKQSICMHSEGPEVNTVCWRWYIQPQAFKIHFHNRPSPSTGVLLPKLINIRTLLSVPHHLLRKMFS